MRKIILIIFVFAGLYADAQVQNIGAPNTTIRARGKFLVDTTFRPPLRDTTGTPTVGEIRYRVADQSLYVCVALTGLRWIQINPVFGNKLNISDTAAMLSPYLRLVTAQGLFLTNTRFLDSLAAHHTRILASGVINLTTTGTSGASTWNAGTRTLNIPTPPTLTASDGVTLNTNNFELGSTSSSGVPLTSTRYINTGTNTLRVRGSSSLYSLKAENTGSGYGAYIESPGIAAQIITIPASTNTSATVLNLVRASTGTPANGIGAQIDFYIQNSIGSSFSNSLSSKWADVVDVSRTSHFDITGVSSGTTQTYANFQPGGIVRVNNLADTLATKAYARSVGGGGGGVAINDATPSLTTTYSSQKSVDLLALKENSLGNPTNNGDIISSTISGVRSWKEPVIIDTVGRFNGYILNWDSVSRTYKHIPPTSGGTSLVTDSIQVVTNDNQMTGNIALNSVLKRLTYAVDSFKYHVAITDSVRYITATPPVDDFTTWAVLGSNQTVANNGLVRSSGTGWTSVSRSNETVSSGGYVFGQEGNTSTTIQKVIGLTTLTTPTSITSINFGCYFGGSGEFYKAESGVYTLIGTYTADSYARVFYDGVTIKYQQSTNGTTWTTTNTSSATPTGSYYVAVALNGAGTAIKNIKHL